MDTLNKMENVFNVVIIARFVQILIHATNVLLTLSLEMVNADLIVLTLLNMLISMDNVNNVVHLVLHVKVLLLIALAANLIKS